MHPSVVDRIDREKENRRELMLVVRSLVTESILVRQFKIQARLFPLNSELAKYR